MFMELEMICLINNAAMLEPLKSIEECGAWEINKNLQISLIAPIVLSSCFIKQTHHFQGRRKIINISSGSGKYPAPDMSIYCTAKAGLNMFTHCVGAEQKSQQLKLSPLIQGWLKRKCRNSLEGRMRMNLECQLFLQMLITMDNYNQLKILGSI